MEPIGGRPYLVETRTYLEHQQGRCGTARRLGRHPNTVDNRGLPASPSAPGSTSPRPEERRLAPAALFLRDGPEFVS